MMNLKNLLIKNFPKIPKWLLAIILAGGIIGFLDSSYLAVQHYKDVIPPCSVLGECETVLTSEYAQIWGVPTSLLGAVYYLFLIITSVIYFDTKNPKYVQLSVVAVALGFIFTLWLLYLQAFIIKAFCEYCLLSAFTTTIMFISVLVLLFKSERAN